jgi:hypothetical protein
MNMYPHLTNVRSSLADQFHALQAPARRDALWARLFGRNTSLAVFPEEAPQKSPNRKFLGMQDIPVEQIMGTLNRQSDFDHKFRPLQSYLRDRWINVSLSLQNGGWPPILVHKVGNKYYVEDGHHRVSVARSLGMTYIQAKVWEYPAQILPTRKCPSASRRESNAIEACAAD